MPILASRLLVTNPHIKEPIMKKLFSTFGKAVALTCALIASGQALADQPDTLTKIKETKTITLGTRESSALSFTTGGGMYTGFHTEMGERIVEDLRKLPGMPAIEIKYQPVTSQNRVPLVQNGSVDLECGSTTNTTARQKDVSFAMTTYMEETGIVTRVN